METLIGTQASAAAPTDSEIIKNGDTSTFMKDVIEMSANVPVVVDFWATWCGPCKTLGPQLEKAVRETKGAVRMVKIDVDRNQDLAQQLRIQSIPAVYAFVNGRPADGFVGAVPESQIKAFVARLLAGQPPQDDGGLQEALDTAKQMVDEGDAQGASEIYREVLQHVPDEPSASAGLLRCLVKLGQNDEAKALLATLTGDLLKHPDVVSAKATLELVGQAAPAGADTELQRKLTENPNDHQARFDLAMANFAAGEREAAADGLLEIVRRDRAWNEEAARKQLVKLFEAFGHTDPLTIQSRKRLSAILFA